MSKKLFSLIRFLVLFVYLCPAFISVSHAKEPIDPPWPWEKELPFPWDSIEGIWRGIHDDQLMIFSFRIIDSVSGERQIKVKEINPETMEKVAEGLGVENNNVLRAVMVGQGHRFRMSVRLIENDYCLDNKQYTVITIETMGRESYVYHFAIEKLSNSPLTQATSINYILHNFSKKSSSSVSQMQPMCFFNSGS